MSWRNPVQKVVLELRKFISRNGHFSIHWYFCVTQYSQGKQLRLCKYPLIPIIKYLKYQATKYSKEALVNTTAATERCSLKIAVP